MNLVTPSEMEEIDRTTISEHGLSSLVLMENAARSALEFVSPGKIGILVGPGNNGGDGLVLARALKEQGRSPRVLLLSENLSPDAKSNLNLAQAWGVEFQSCYSDEQEHIIDDLLEASDLIVDALFGTGLSRPLENRWKYLVEQSNASGKEILSIDIPSGVSGKDGQVLGAAMRAWQTVTFGCLKRGHVLFPGKAHCGSLRLTQPGFHPTALAKYDRVQLFTAERASKTLPKSWPTMHKGDNGRVLMITGSESYPGAGVISTLGALRAGAGLTTHYLPDALAGTLMQWTPEAMPKSRNEALDLDNYNAVVVGCGLGSDADRLSLEVLEKANIPVVVDAEALNSIHKVDRERRDHLVLTPHPGELGRLLGQNVTELEQDRVNTALKAAESLNCVVCFKGAPTVIANPQGRAFVNSTGNSILAQGGSGDLLAGIIGAYLAYGLPLFDATASGAFIHGLASDLATEKIGPRGVTAVQIAELVPLAYAKVVGDPSPFPVF